MPGWQPGPVVVITCCACGCCACGVAHGVHSVGLRRQACDIIHCAVLSIFDSSAGIGLLMISEAKELDLVTSAYKDRLAFISLY